MQVTLITNKYSNIPYHRHLAKATIDTVVGRGRGRKEEEKGRRGRKEGRRETLRARSDKRKIGKEGERNS